MMQQLDGLGEVELTNGVLLVCCFQGWNVIKSFSCACFILPSVVALRYRHAGVELGDGVHDRLCWARVNQPWGVVVMRRDAEIAFLLL